MNSYDAIIVGGGVNGAAIAYNLSKRGLKVAVFEKEKIAGKSSGAAAGMLAAQAEVEQDGPLFTIARRSREMFPQLSDEIKEQSGIDIELMNKGMYKVAITNEEEVELKKLSSLQQRLGECAEWIDRDELSQIEPNISKDVRGAMYIQRDGHVSAPALSIGLMRSAIRLGTELYEYTDVQSFIEENGVVKGVMTEKGQFFSGVVVVTTGAWTKRVLEKTSLHLDIFPVKGECFSVKSNKPILTATLFSKNCYIVPKTGGRLIVGATMQPHTFDETVTVEGIATLMKQAILLVPEIASAQWEKAWAGIRPQTKDGLPYLGEHPHYKGLFVAAGHYRNGILLAPLTGRVLADMITGEKIDPIYKHFDLNRIKVGVK
ncbi:glycine oxidase ThiO [Bacillus timonensis]|nr:glycine oxidase ThiO [Bacillus timonensis]